MAPYKAKQVVLLLLFKAEECLQTAIDTWEAHEGKTQETNEEHHNDRREGIDHRLQEIIVLLSAEDGHTQYNTVGRGQRRTHTFKHRVLFKQKSRGLDALGTLL